jgi:hypothetical protein
MEPSALISLVITWDEGSISCSTKIQTLNEAMAKFANLYTKVNAKCWLLTEFLDRPITNLDDFGCPSRESFAPGAGCSLLCHKFPDNCCAACNERSFRVFEVPPQDQRLCEVRQRLYTSYCSL